MILIHSIVRNNSDAETMRQNIIREDGFSEYLIALLKEPKIAKYAIQLLAFLVINKDPAIDDKLEIRRRKIFYTGAVSEIIPLLTADDIVIKNYAALALAALAETNGKFFANIRYTNIVAATPLLSLIDLTTTKATKAAALALLNLTKEDVRKRELVINTLYQYLLNKKNSLAAIKHITTALMKFEIIPTLTIWLATEDKRDLATVILGRLILGNANIKEFISPEIFSALINLLSDNENRIGTLETLGVLTYGNDARTQDFRSFIANNTRVLNYLNYLLISDDTTIEVKISTAEFLGNVAAGEDEAANTRRTNIINTPDLLSSLATLLRHPDLEMKKAAANVLRNLATGTGEEANIRRQRIINANIASALVELLENADQEAKEIAIVALDELAKGTLLQKQTICSTSLRHRDLIKRISDDVTKPRIVRASAASLFFPAPAESTGIEPSVISAHHVVVS